MFLPEWHRDTMYSIYDNNQSRHSVNAHAMIGTKTFARLFSLCFVPIVIPLNRVTTLYTTHCLHIKTSFDTTAEITPKYDYFCIPKSEGARH